MTATIHPIRIQSKQAALASSDNLAIRFIKHQEAEGITGLSCTEIYHRVAAENFPEPVMFGPKCAVWVEAAIYGWMNYRIAESRAVA